MSENYSRLTSEFWQQYNILPTRFESANNDEMGLSEHIEEFSQRLIFCLISLVCSTLICFTDIREIVKVFQAPAVGIQFLQFAQNKFKTEIHHIMLKALFNSV